MKACPITAKLQACYDFGSKFYKLEPRHVNLREKREYYTWQQIVYDDVITNTARSVITENLPIHNGVKAFRMSKGTNSSKVVIIGRNMDDVRLFKQGLVDEGFEVEIFDGDVIPKSALDEFADFKKDGIWVEDADLPNTIMYQANKEWIERMVAEGYDIYDIGNLNALTGDGLADGWYSAFYDMEGNIVFP